jgi:hypothetical protein
MSAGSNADQILRYKGFNVEIKGADNAPQDIDRAWVTMAVGSIAEKTLEAGQHQPGKAYVEEIALRGPLTPDRKSMTEWLNDTANGRDPHRTVTVTLIPLDPKQLEETFIFEDAYVTGYVFPPLVLDDPCPPELIEELRFAYGRLTRVP